MHSLPFPVYKNRPGRKAMAANDTFRLRFLVSPTLYLTLSTWYPLSVHHEITTSYSSRKARTDMAPRSRSLATYRKAWNTNATYTRGQRTRSPSSKNLTLVLLTKAALVAFPMSWRIFHLHRSNSTEQSASIQLSPSADVKSGPTRPSKPSRTRVS
jgi:hypothetical protein